MAGLNYNNVGFMRSAASEKQFVHSSLPAVVFAGKSNVGKSSVINRILNRKNFARVGNTPGKTVHVNYFNIDSRMLFIDLPGYGFADVSKSERDRWSSLMEGFFADPESFTYGILIVDSRHKPTADDIRMAEWFKSSGKPYTILANKLDKLKKSEIDSHLAEIRTILGVDDDMLIPFSAEKGTGRDALIRILEAMC